MGYPTTIQLIQRQRSQQWYVNFPAALAHAMGFAKGETVEWTLLDRGRLLTGPPQSTLRAPNHLPQKTLRRS